MGSIRRARFILDLHRLQPGQSRWHFGTNLFDPADREAVTVDYVDVHAFGMFASLVRCNKYWRLTTNEKNLAMQQVLKDQLR